MYLGYVLYSVQHQTILACRESYPSQGCFASQLVSPVLLGSKYFSCIAGQQEQTQRVCRALKQQTTFSGCQGVAQPAVTNCMKGGRAKRNLFGYHLVAGKGMEKEKSVVNQCSRLSPGEFCPLQAMALKSLPQVELSRREVWGLFSFFSL